MADKYKRLVIGDARGGRNGVDPPLTLRENEVVDAVNVEYFHSSLGRKRQGILGAQAGFSSGGPFTGKLSSLFRHVPSTDETVAEQWAVDDALVFGRKSPASNTFFQAPTLKDAAAGNGWDVDWATLNGKLFIAYRSGSGFTAPGAPTVANTGAGTYAATLRYYRARWIQQVAGVTTRRSPVGTSASFTPSGGGTAARVTRAAAPGQGETHWELEVSYDNSTFYVLYGDGGLYAPIVIATTTGDDSTAAAAVTVIETLIDSGTWVRPSWVSSGSYAILGAGGAGGSVPGGGGGGGGRLKTGTFSASAASYAYTVGQGVAGASGGASTMFSVTANGGGKGGDTSAGTAGGNGGGGSGSGNAGGATNDGGNAGGAGLVEGGGGATGGGGGGNGAVGANATTTGGNGGNGTASSISGASVTYGGGGGGNAFSNASGTGGTGGGGNGGAGGNPSTAGTDGLGGGGGGGEGKRGGHGTIILSYSNLSIASASTSNADNTDRLHLWDGYTVRRAGLATPSAPTAANTGAGAYAATLRYYRVRWVQQSGGVAVRRSEPGATVSFTPSGGGTAARVTQPAVANEGETHWEVEGSADNVSFYVLSTVAIATTTYDDSTAPASYSTGTNLSPVTGTYTPQRSYRFIASDQGRLLGFGSWTQTNRQNDIEVSSVIGSLNVGDAERLDTTSTYRYTLDENDSGAPTGLRGPVFGNFYAFKFRQFWELAPTGLTSNPYRRTPISKTIGCVQRGASCVGEDTQGNGALYFFSHRGLYVYGVGGLRYLGKGIEDYVLGPTATINLGATNVIAWVCYYPFKRQVWVGWATGSSNDPNQTAIFDITSNGWSRVPTGDKLANIRCAHLFSNTIGTTMSLDLKPYVASATTATALSKGDTDGQTSDGGTTFQAYILTRPVEPGGPGFNGTVGDPLLTAQVSTGVTITATVIPDFDATFTKTGTATLTAANAETRVSNRLEGMALTSAQFVQYQVGDASAIANSWNLDRLVVTYVQNESVSG